MPDSSLYDDVAARLGVTPEEAAKRLAAGDPAAEKAAGGAHDAQEWPRSLNEAEQPTPTKDDGQMHVQRGGEPYPGTGPSLMDDVGTALGKGYDAVKSGLGFGDSDSAGKAAGSTFNPEGDETMSRVVADKPRSSNMSMVGDLDTLGPQGQGGAPRPDETTQATPSPTTPPAGGPGPAAAATSAAKTSNETAITYQSLLDKFAEEVKDPEGRAAIKSLQDTLAQVNDDYKKEKADLQSGEKWEAVGNALGKLGAGLYGMHHNVDMSGTKFEKDDWLGKMKNLREEFATRLADVEGQRRDAEQRHGQTIQQAESKASLGGQFAKLAQDAQDQALHRQTQLTIAGQHHADSMAQLAQQTQHNHDLVNLTVDKLNQQGQTNDAKLLTGDQHKILQVDASVKNLWKDIGNHTENIEPIKAALRSKWSIMGVPQKEQEDNINAAFGQYKQDTLKKVFGDKKLWGNTINDVQDNVNKIDTKLGTDYNVAYKYAPRPQREHPYPAPGQPPAAPPAGATAGPAPAPPALNNISKPPGPSSDWVWNTSISQWQRRTPTTAGK